MRQNSLIHRLHATFAVSRFPFPPRSCVAAMVLVATWFGGSWTPLGAQDLGNARLQIAGTRLIVPAEVPSVPLKTPTLVETRLEGYDADLGVLPQEIRVVAELRGPGLGESLQLETYPNEPFRIPSLSATGEHRLEDVRLVQGGELLVYAEPRSVSIQVVKLLISEVRTRALTDEEIRAHGLVVEEGNRDSLYLSFAYGYENRKLQFGMPLLIDPYGPEDLHGVPENASFDLIDQDRTVRLSGRFAPPRLQPFRLLLAPEEREEIPHGGCSLTEVCRNYRLPEPKMVGVVFFPTELSLLHQMFSVVLVVQNGALEGSGLTLEDLQARIKIPSGLRQAETNPPTPLGVPVPVRVPGADGELGTSDDLTVIVAQASAEAEFLVEGLREGNHVVEFDLQGILRGLPGGSRQISGKARGAVLVRDPTLSVTSSHPRVVRANTPYTTRFTVTNLGNQPVNDLEIGFPTSGLSNVRLAEGEVNVKPAGSLLPGESSMVDFRMVPLISGTLHSTSARGDDGASPRFDVTMGVSDGVPLSPEVLALPEVVETLPEELGTAAVTMLGIAHSLANAPYALVADKPRVTSQDVSERAYRLVEAGKHRELGEEAFEAVGVLATEWAGARDQSWEWDELRRTHVLGLELAEVVGATLSAEEPDPRTALERLAAANHYLHPWLALAEGAEIQVKSRVSGKRSTGFLAEAVRELPFAELLPLTGGELAMLTRPEPEGIRVRIGREASGAADLTVVVPGADLSPLRMISWNSVSLDAGAAAWVDVEADASVFDLQVDDDGDGVADRVIPGSESSLARRPFTVVAARQNTRLDPTGHMVHVLFSEDLDLASLLPADPDRFRVPGKESNGGMTVAEISLGTSFLGVPGFENQFEGMANPRIVQVIFDNPLGPFEGGHTLTVDDLRSSEGAEIVNQSLPVEVTAHTRAVQLEGLVRGPDGEPVPFAELRLVENVRVVDQSGPSCVYHPTARAQADATGRYHFPYVRQGECGDTFRVKAKLPGEPILGESVGRVRFLGETQTLDVIMHGRGALSGRVTYEDGTVPLGVEVVAKNMVTGNGWRASVDASGRYLAESVEVGTVTISAWDELGNQVFQTVELPAAGAGVEQDLTVIRRPDEPAPGTVRGTVRDASTSEPEADAWVALYVDGSLVGTETTAKDGSFDFGMVPSGQAEIVAFDFVTRERGAQLFFELLPDEVETVDLLLLDEQGVIEGHAVRVALDGTVTPMPGADVWVNDLPYHVVTDETGYFRLENIPLGNREVHAVDADRLLSTSTLVTLDSSNTTRNVTLYFEEELDLDTAITGVVYGEDGLPVKDARVHLAQGFGSSRWTYDERTDANGSFRIGGLQPGVYGVHAIKGDEGAIGWAELRFPGDADHVEIHFRSGTIRGRTFYVDPASGEEVPVVSRIFYARTRVISVWDLVGLDRSFQALTTESDGTFEIPALYGPFMIRARNAFHGSSSVDGYLDMFSDELQIQFEPNGSIRGTVYRADGETAVSDAEVTLRGGQFESYTVYTDANGEFFFDLVPEGGYKIQVTSNEGTIHRYARVGAALREPGERLEDVRVLLPRQGSVVGWVERPDGARVPGSTVRLVSLDHAVPDQITTADVDGRYSFYNVFEGRLAVIARVPELGGGGGRARYELGAEGEEVQTVVTVDGLGTLSGRVLSPDDGQPVYAAKVRLERGFHLFDATQTDEDGRYTFERLPVGTYRAKIFDPTSGRRGLAELATIAEHGDLIEMETYLEARGTVEGHVYAPPENGVVIGETIQLHSQGLKWFTVFSSTDTEGHFTFGGIPEGDFKLTNRSSERRARAEGRIEHEDQVVVQDLYLEELKTLRGVVFGPKNADGVPGPLMENVNIQVQQSGLAGASSENPFVIDRLLPRSTLIRVQEPGGRHVVADRIDLSRLEQDELELELVMRAIGEAEIFVVDSLGEAVPSAQVTLRNRYSLRNGAPVDDHGESESFSAQADATGFVSFGDLHEGRLQVRATDPATGLKGRGSGTITYEGEKAVIEVRLQPSGEVGGEVVRSDGVTPAIGTVVALKLPHEGWRFEETDDAGRFRFESLPLATYEIDFQELDAPGSHHLTGELVTDQQVDEHFVVLDDEDPRVIAIEPAVMARDVPLDSPIVLRFSEPMADCGSCGSGLRLQDMSTGSLLSRQVTWSENGTVATLAPDGLLASATMYRVRARSDLRDPAGRQLEAFVSGFTTADVEPPQVIDLRPAPDQNQVELETSVRIQFSEPVNTETLSGAFRLLDQKTGTALTLTTLVRLNDRGVTLTAVEELQTDREYRLEISGVADPSGNVMPDFASSFWTLDQTAPAIAWQAPAAQRTFVAGDPIEVVVDVADRWAIGEVQLRLGEWSSPLFTAPSEGESTYRWTVPAPVMEVAGEVEIHATALDEHGNLATSTRSVWVEPLHNEVPPVVTVGCPVDGDLVAPGEPHELGFRVSDDLAVESAWFEVDGAEIERRTPIDRAETAMAFAWTPPAEAAPGTSFAVDLATRDFAGNVTRIPLVLSVPASTLLYEGHDLASATGDVYLARGEHDLAADLDLSSLTLLQGARLVAAPGTSLRAQGEIRQQCGSAGELARVDATDLVLETGAVMQPLRLETLRINATGATIEAGAVLDASGRGYLGHDQDHEPPYAPEGTEPAREIGASHGGVGGAWTTHTTQPAYDSVYVPHMAGAGGGNRNYDAGGTGGGVIDLRVGSLHLDGTIDASGNDASDDEGTNGGGGAGGSVLVEADTVSGAGSIDVGGGDSYHCIGGGGGGRIALYIGGFQGFEPELQVFARGGGEECSEEEWGGAGTIYLETTAEPEGILRIANRSDRSDPGLGRSTLLPTLGSGTLQATQVEGADLWVFGSTDWSPSWLGAWMRLDDGSGTVVGTYRVAEIDGTGLRLRDADQAHGAVGYAGVYRFGRLEADRTALATDDELEFAGAVTLGGEMDLDTELRAGAVEVAADADLRLVGGMDVTGDVVVRSGARIEPLLGDRLSLRVGGTLTLESGAEVDVSALGYTAGAAPDGIAGSDPGVGGSHGGEGGRNETAEAGEVYDSVYRPRLAGGGGSNAGSYGGGVIVVEASEVVLDGSLRATGREIGGTTPSGAGGTVTLDAARLSGNGVIDASGGLGFGGGGRVALRVGELAGFDPSAQARAWGSYQHYRYPDTFPESNYAPAGTVFVHTASSVFGDLLVDNGTLDDGSDRHTWTTELPILGDGAVAGAVAVGSDLEIDLGQEVLQRWHETYVELQDGAGGILGTYRVGEIGATTLRLEGAAEHAGIAATYRGLYRFDRLVVSGGAGLRFDEAIRADRVELNDRATVEGIVRGGDVVLGSDAVVTSPRWGAVEIAADGEIKIPADARIDLGGRSAYNETLVPANVATGTSAGSHGGPGWGSDPGEIFGSVYQPRHAGGRSSETSSSRAGGRISLEADVLRLDGLLDVQGGPETHVNLGGAGGTVTIRARQVLGSGRIDAGGSDLWQGAGGGGRVALYVEDLALFDETAQVDVSGGWDGEQLEDGTWNGGWTQGGPGTLYVFDQTSTFGRLVMDNRVGERSGLERTTGLLPSTGTGTIGVAEPDAQEPAHLWVEPQDPAALFDLGVEGMWLRIHDGVTETEYRILAEDGNRRRILLENAVSTVTAGQTYRGVYKFDEVVVHNYTFVDFEDFVEAAAWDVDSTSGVQASNFAITLEVTSTGPAAEGASFLLEGTFEDQELGQTHQATVDWGDGSPVEPATLVDTDPGSFGASHTWADDGVYVVEVCVEDADGDGRSACGQAEITVANVAPVLTLGEETFEGWITEEAPVEDRRTRSADWTVSTSADGEIEVKPRPAKPSVYYDPGTAPGRRWTGTLQMGIYRYSGFVFGFQEGEVASAGPATDYLLMVWSNGTEWTIPGLRIYRIRGGSDFWTFEEATTELVAVAATQGDQPYVKGHPYAFEIDYSQRRLRVVVDGTVEFDLRPDAASLDGHIGFFQHDGDPIYVGFETPSGSVSEGLPISLDATFTDVGLLDVHLATVDWGDGSSVEAATVTGGAGAGTVATPPHVYAQDGDYVATICVDDGVLETCSTMPVTVYNDLPVLSTPELRVTEGDGTTQELATFTDYGALDVHTATVDWGDGTQPSAAPVELVDGSTSPASWRVLSPVSLPVGIHSAEVCVTDDAPETACALLSIVVEGVSAPTLAAPADATVDEGETWTVTTTFADADAGDVHVATVDWGDGSPLEDALLDPAAGTIEASHAYGDDGSYAVEVCVGDLAGMSACAGATATVANVAPTPHPLELGLERWTDETQATSYPDPVWQLSADGADASLAESSDPTHLRSDWPARHHRVRGSLKGDGAAFLGFGIGVQSSDLGSNAEVDYVLVSWKRGGSAAAPGLRAYRITSADPDLLYLSESTSLELLATAANLGNTSWTSGQVYDVEIEIFGDSFRLWIDGALELDVPVAVADGSFSFYAYNQPGAFLGFARKARVLREGETLDLDVRFTDPGSQDAVTAATIDWGDGTAVEPLTVTQAGVVEGLSEGQVTGNHLYATPGHYTATLCVTDDDATEGCATFPVRVDAEADYTAPTATVSGVASSYHAGQTLDAVIDTSDNVGTTEVRVTFDGTTTTLTNADFSQTFHYSTQVDPTLTTARGTTFEAVALDQAGNESIPVSVPVDLLPDDPAALAVGVLPGLEVDPGTTLDVTADVTDDVRVETVRFELSGAYAEVSERTIGAATASELWQPTLPADLAPGSLTTLAVEVTDSFGHVTRHESEIRINGDAIAPEVTITLDPVRSGDVYSGGEVVTVTATATDNIGVDTFSLTVDGQTVSGASPLSVTWTAPPTASTATHAVHAEAVDVDGNVGTADRTVTVEPHVNAVAPEVAFGCPTDGALFPSAYDLTLQAAAVDDEGIARIELFRGAETTPIATVTPDVGTSPSLDLAELVTLPTLSGSPQSVSYRVVAYDAALNTAEDVVSFDVVETVDLDTGGANDWTALESATAVLRSGTLEVTQARTLGGLIVLDGASLSHPQSAPGSETALDLTVNGPVYVACGGSINATGKGYGPDETYPGESLPGKAVGGSHLGLAGQFDGYAVGSSFGSVYYPQESGGGGEYWKYAGLGGGVLYVRAASVTVDGAIRANGTGEMGGYTRGGAGGSIWIDASGTVGGSGVLEARGAEAGDHKRSSGGGGAIAVYHQGLAAGLASRLLAEGGAQTHSGGAGTVYLHGPTSVYGDLSVDAGTVVDGVTSLPDLGRGVAQTGSLGSRLETLSAAQPYFVGHWVEIYDASSGALEGTWRVESTDATGLDLESGATVDPGDIWQGVYRFDSLSLRGDVKLLGDDPIRVSGPEEIEGTVETERITANSLVLRTGSVLRHPPTTDASAPASLSIELQGDLMIEAGAEIDLSGLGYGAGETYPGESLPGTAVGGSHLGLAGSYSGNPVGSSYGSVYYPQESGGGGEYWKYAGLGGGVLYVRAASVTVDGAIRANGTGEMGGYTRGGAGGSIWIDASGTVDGSGVLEARGAEAGDYERSSGGGGAIAVYHQGLASGLASRLLAEGGARTQSGGAGTVYLFGPSSVYGNLVVDAGTVADGVTSLPALGSGIAQPGSLNRRLETGSQAQPYFVGHWVEIYDAATGLLKGTWRIESMDATGLDLESGATVDPGDAWQGVYRFDSLSLRGDVELAGDDPVRVSGTQEIDGTVETDRITATDLVLRSGSVLRHPMTTDPLAPSSLSIDLQGDLMIEAGAEIDLSGLGYGPDQTYSGEILPFKAAGGSHLGLAGEFEGSPGSSYGSVYFPSESGGGGEHSSYGGRGGGVLSVRATSVTIDGAIRSNGTGDRGGYTRGGAGGSIWIDAAGTVSGTGLVEARGADAGNSERSSGGGGAVAIYHQGLDTGLRASLLAYGGTRNNEGGAGAIYLYGPTSVYGDLIVDSGSIEGNWTELPSLGAGVAGSGSGGSTLDTDLASPIQPYFVGHFVEIYDGTSGAFEDVYRISDLVGDGTEILLDPAASSTPSVEPGDLWQGVYLFDEVHLLGSSLSFHSDDPVVGVEGVWVDGEVTTRRIVGGDLVLAADAVLGHPPEDGSGEGLDVQLTGDVHLGSGAAIDVSGLGYAPNVTHPSAAIGGGGAGGSHMGHGGYATPGTTYGSVYWPWEHGSGGQYATYGERGGGRVRILARDLNFASDLSAIRANGLDTDASKGRGGAGGSVWIDLTGQITGDGLIEASGGRSGGYEYGSGGGGAISLTYAGIQGAALDRVRSWTGNLPDYGGAGTVYLLGPTSTEGDLLVDGGGIVGRDTDLPSLGSGLALTGSTGDLLVTDRATAIPDYFLGHRVEVSNSTGVVKGTYPILEIVDGTSVRLGDDDGALPSVAEGDQWRGVYLFDAVTVQNGAILTSGDAIFEAGTEITP